MKNNLKTKKTTMLILVSLITTLVFVGYTNDDSDRIVFPGGSSVQSNKLSGTASTNYYRVDGDQVYLTIYDTDINITEYCSSENYFIDQVIIDDYLQTIIIGGNVNGVGNDELKIVHQLGYIEPTNKQNFGEMYYEENSEDMIERAEIAERAEYSTCSIYPMLADINDKPQWLLNAIDDYNLKLIGINHGL